MHEVQGKYNIHNVLVNIMPEKLEMIKNRKKKAKTGDESMGG